MGHLPATAYESRAGMRGRGGRHRRGASVSLTENDLYVLVQVEAFSRMWNTSVSQECEIWIGLKIVGRVRFAKAWQQ